MAGARLPSNMAKSEFNRSILFGTVAQSNDAKLRTVMWSRHGLRRRYSGEEEIILQVPAHLHLHTPLENCHLTTSNLNSDNECAACRKMLFSLLDAELQVNLD